MENHTGPEPESGDICGTCGKPYGEHYGPAWPAPSDCPGPDGRRMKNPTQFWSWSALKEKDGMPTSIDEYPLNTLVADLRQADEEIVRIQARVDGLTTMKVELESKIRAEFKRRVAEMSDVEFRLLLDAVIDRRDGRDDCPF